MRALFQILIGIATHSTVARMTSTASQACVGGQVEQAAFAETVSERLAEDFESDRRGQQDHDPVNLQPPHEPPDVAVDFGEEERREVPDRFLRAEFPQAAAGKAAADRERERNPLARHDRGNPDHGANDGACVGAGKQPDQERARERQVRRVVVDEQARHDPGRQRKAEAGDKDEPLRPVALFRQQDAAEPREADEHRGQDRDDRQFHDERREQELFGGELPGGLRHGSA